MTHELAWPQWSRNAVLATFLGIVITPWKLVGYLGVALFTGRWFVQMAASRVRGQPKVPLLFWYMSIAGSVLCLAYFIFGKNDSVGILSNAFRSRLRSTICARHCVLAKQLRPQSATLHNISIRVDS